jgi:hypothetical protein
MRFIVRHQISHLEEEVYEFEVTNAYIKYVCFWCSKRNSENDPFGFDWDKFYKDQKYKELDKLDEIYGLWDDIGEHEFYHPKNIAEKEIIEKYNPVAQGLLYGSSSSVLHKQYPLKISKELVLEKAIEHLKGLCIE